MEGLKMKHYIEKRKMREEELKQFTPGKRVKMEVEVVEWADDIAKKVRFDGLVYEISK